VLHAILIGGFLCCPYVPGVTRDILQILIVFIDVWSWDHKDLSAVTTTNGAFVAGLGSLVRLLEG
jgi:hypothetical protein